MRRLHDLAGLTESISYDPAVNSYINEVLHGHWSEFQPVLLDVLEAVRDA